MKKEKINGQSGAINAINKRVSKNNTLKQWQKEYEIEKGIIESIIETRKEKGITQFELAKLTGIKQSTISRIEKRLDSPQLSTIVSIAEVLDMKICLERKV